MFGVMGKCMLSNLLCCVVGSSVALVRATHAFGHAFAEVGGMVGGWGIVVARLPWHPTLPPCPCFVEGSKAVAGRHQPFLVLLCHVFRRYEEVTRIPLVFSNPKLWPKPRESEALVSHIDVS